MFINILRLLPILSHQIEEAKYLTLYRIKSMNNYAFLLSFMKSKCQMLHAY